MANNVFCPPGAGNRVRGYISEVLGLSPAEVRGVAVRLLANLTNTTPGTAKYQIPSDQAMVITQVHGFIRIRDYSAEPTAIFTFLNPDPSERWFVKASNCIVQLENTDRSLDLFDNGEIPLGAITPPVGSPLFFPLEMPYIVPSAHNLQATFTLQDSGTDAVGSATDYGIILTGALIPWRE